ncbi:MAG: peptide transporter, partial [Candidatus Latescibacterota bacterium]
MRKGRFRRHWAEVEEYRGLLEPPGEFHGGLTLRTLLGVLFIALVLTPGELYLGLFSGGGISGAGPWLAAVLFVELARRSFISLRRQEIFLLVYVASALVSREDGAFVELLWRQYFAHSAEAIGAGVAELLPRWWVPGAGSAALTERSLFHRDWLWPIAVMVIGTIVGRLAWFSSGYLFFRAASDHERLPFPTAPAAALSSMALAEEGGTETRTWKWPVFSLGALVGAAFGILYVGLPAVTALLGARTSILPVPFLDLTPYLGDLLPAAPVAVTLHLGAVLTGMLMPFWLVVGGFVGTVAHLAAG